MYADAFFESIFCVTQAPMVTAGLKWPPDRWPTEETITAIASPDANAIATRLLFCVWMTAPAPKKINVKVPTNSASSFWFNGRSIEPPFAGFAGILGSPPALTQGQSDG